MPDDQHQLSELFNFSVLLRLLSIFLLTHLGMTLCRGATAVLRHRLCAALTAELS